MASTGGRKGLLHALGVSPQQRLHLAALLIAGLASALSAQDISFDPAISRDEFRKFSAILGQTIYATPVQPGGNRGLLAFDIGVAAVAVPIDENAEYWIRSVGSDFSTGGYVAAPRLVVSKGLGFASVSGSYARVQDSDIEMWGGSVDVPLLGGSLVTPSLTLRGSYSQLTGIDELDLRSYGAEVLLSKGFGIVTPYAGAGLTRTDASATIPATNVTPAFTFDESMDKSRFTLGLRVSFLGPRFVIEATQGEERSYAAKVSFGL